MKAAEALIELDADKSRVNRLLEPWMWHTVIITASEWDNFFALRSPPGPGPTADFPAQIEFQKLALLMRYAMQNSEPQQIDVGGWHTPYVHREDVQGTVPIGVYPVQDPFWLDVSAGRCAKVSYLTQDRVEDPKESFDRSAGLKQYGHMSPLEHQATPRSNIHTGTPEGKFKGWTQYRQLIPHQENRVGFLEERPNWMNEPVDLSLIVSDVPREYN